MLSLLHVAGEAEAPARSYAELSFRARQMLMAFIMEVVENAVGPLFSTLATTGKLAPLSWAGPSVPSWVRPPTGEPDAGDLQVRFGGRGWRKPLPTPIQQEPDSFIPGGSARTPVLNWSGG